MNDYETILGLIEKAKLQPHEVTELQVQLMQRNSVNHSQITLSSDPSFVKVMEMRSRVKTLAATSKKRR
jgi:hypothetical protein